MTGNNILGIIFSNAHDEVLSEMTDVRTMGSIPFCGRYRLIDFPLSNMVNCGISKVGVITKSNYQSLMDHLGTGKPWDLSRKREGMFLLPPFNRVGTGMYSSRIDALRGIMGFITASNEDYVLLTDCNVVSNLDCDKLFAFHKKKGADITLACTHGSAPCLEDSIMTLSMDEDSRVREISLNAGESKEGYYSINVVLMRKYLLERLINDASNHNYNHFQKDLIMRNVDKLKICGYPMDGFVRVIDSLQSYYDISMSLLDSANRRALFTPDHPIYTKVRDDMPARYGLDSDVKNSLVADGCTIEGKVENSVLFRGVTVSKGAVVKNSILMQGTYVGDNARLNCVITDKTVAVKNNVELSGASTFPVYVGKNSVI